MLTTILDNFYVTAEELDKSISRLDGIDKETETMLRLYGAELIQEAGIFLRCPQAVMATGQVLLQRFYVKKSFKDFNVKRLAAASTFIACKLEESPRRIRDIILVFDRLFKGQPEGGPPPRVLEPGGREYNSAKDTIIRYERDMLRAFGFILHAEHPHKFVINYIHMLGGSNELIQLAWNVLNDSLRTTLCVRFKSEVVACGAIFYAARKLEVPLPDSVPWWEVFNCKTDQLVDVVITLHELYSHPKAQYIHVSKDAAPGGSAKPQASESTAILDYNCAPSVPSPLKPDGAASRLTGGVATAPPSGQGEVAPLVAGLDDTKEATSSLQQDPPQSPPERVVAAPAPTFGENGEIKAPVGSEETSEERRSSYGKDSERDRDRDHDRDRDRHRSKHSRDDRGHGRDRDDPRSRSRSRERKHRDRDRDRDSDRDRDRDRDREGRGGGYRDHRDKDRHRSDRDRDGRKTEVVAMSVHGNCV
eukprot:gene10693-12385_t